MQAEAKMPFTEIHRKGKFNDSAFCVFRAKFEGMDARPHLDVRNAELGLYSRCTETGPDSCLAGW